MSNEITINTKIAEIDRNVFEVSLEPLSDACHLAAQRFIYDLNQMIETELLQKVTTGVLTRMKHQIELELLRRGIK